MQFLTSLMSTIFGLLMLILAAMVLLSFESRMLTPLDLIWGISLLAFLSWIGFRLLDWTYKKVHPAVYTSSRYAHGAGVRFTVLQAVVSSLRSAVLGMAIPTVALGLLLLVFIPLQLVMENSNDSIQNKGLLLLASEILLFGVLGWIVQWRYNRSVLKLMQEKSAKSAKRRNTTKKSRTTAGKLQLRILDAKKGTQLSKRGAEKQQAAKRLERLGWLRDVGAPLAALGGMMASYPEDLPSIGLLVVGAVLFVLAWLGSTLRLADRTPLRQFRLGFGLWMHALLVAFIAPLMFLFELPGSQGWPDKQWTIVPKLGRWVSDLLRSPRLFWIPAMLFVSMVPLLGMSKNIEAEDVLKAFVSLLVGIIAFEVIYRLFDRFLQGRQGRLKRLVFLRVFGDRRRGHFLFRHIAPRWKGLGSITCIAAPDVSVHQLEADIGFDILFGRLRQRFLTRDEAGVIGRHINSEALGMVWEDHCFDDTWMSAVQSMLTQNAIVLMDLRGFGPQREGCIYEMSVLRDNISMGAVVFLIDETTDFEFLKSTLDQLWKTIASDSPNTNEAEAGVAKNKQITIFRMSASKRKSAAQLTRLLIEACVSSEVYHQAHGQLFLNQLIDDLQLLAADAPAQIKAVGGGRWPGKKVLEAGYSADHDLGNVHYLFSWGLINDQQDNAISDVDEAVQYIRCSDIKQTAVGLGEDPAWQELRIAARNSLKALGKRRTLPKVLK